MVIHNGKLITLGLLCLCMAGCSPGADDKGKADGTASSGDSGAAASQLTGSVVIEGSSTVEPVSIRARELFNEIHKQVNVSVSGQGTGNGFKALAKKECDVADASRPIKKAELDSCVAAGQEFFEIPVAYDGLTIAVNKDNDFVDQLTVEQLTKIYRKDQAAKTWKEVNPEWPDEKIAIFAAGVASGTHDYFMEVIDKDSVAGMRDDEQIQKSEDDKILVTGVKNDRLAIGFFGYSYYEAYKADLRAVPIVNEAGKAVAPGVETIESGEYSPFSRPLFIYVAAGSYQRAEVREFVDFYLENIRKIVTEARYVPLPDGIYTEARARLDKEQKGTHFLDADGKKRHGAVADVYSEANLIAK